MFFIEAPAQVLKQQRVVVLVFRAEAVPCPRLGGKLPVDVEAVEMIAVDELDCAVNEMAAARFVTSDFKNPSRRRFGTTLMPSMVATIVSVGRWNALRNAEV